MGKGRGGRRYLRKVVDYNAEKGIGPMGRGVHFMAFGMIYDNGYGRFSTKASGYESLTYLFRTSVTLCRSFIADTQYL